MQNNLFNNSTVEVGKFNSEISLIWTLITSIFWCVVAYYMYKNISKDEFAETIAKVTKADCKYYNCDEVVTYEVNGKKYSGDLIVHDEIKYKVGFEIDILYNKKNPNIIKPKSKFATDSTLNIIKYIWPCALLFMGLSPIARILYGYFMVHKYDIYASIYGTGAAFGQGFRSPL